MAACLYQENRVSLEPGDVGTAEYIFVPSSASSTFGLRDYPKRRRVEPPLIHDEATFHRERLATESSIYFRPESDAYPRAILWRILDSNQILELQSVDLYHDSQHKKTATSCIRFRFDNPLIPQGVVFTTTTEPQSRVVVHAVTGKGDVITLTLGDEILRQPRLLQDGQEASTWWRTYSPSALKIRQAYRLLTWDGEKELYVTLNDGNVARLKQYGSEGWKESIFSDSTWTSSMRGLFKSHVTARYGNAEMGPKAACSAVLSPTGALLWTVCLDHTVRVWSTTSGRMVQRMDLARLERDLDQPVMHLFDPHTTNLIQVIKLARHHDRYFLATYSPTARSFKILQIEEIEEDDIVITDYKPDFQLKPPIDDLIDTIGWQLVNFNLTTPRTEGDSQWTLWMLIRSGSSSHTFTIKFDADEIPNKLERAWQNQWAKVHPGFSTMSFMKSQFDATIAHDNHLELLERESIFERWLAWLHCPDHFSYETLETALAIYVQSHSDSAKRPKADKKQRDVPFAQRVSVAINALVPVYVFEDDDQFLEHQHQLLAHIKIFNGVLEDLQHSKERTLALAFDRTSDIPWLVMADELSAVRSCCDLEILSHNHKGYSEQHRFTTDTLLLRSLATASTSSLGVVMHVLHLLHESLTPEFIALVRSAIYTDILRSPANASIESRIQSIFERSHFESQISDETYDQLSLSLENLGGWKDLDTKSFMAIFELFGQDIQGKPQNKRLAHYGTRCLVRGAQDTLQLEDDVLVNIIILIIFMSCELHQEDLAESLALDDIYSRASTLLRERMILSWTVYTKDEPKTSGDKPFPTKDVAPSIRSNTSTVFETLFIDRWTAMQTPKAPPIDLIMYWTRAWTFEADLSADYESKIPYIMSRLLQNSRIELAESFIKFMPSTIWATYVSGRYYLMVSDFLEAARKLESIAEDVSVSFDVSQYDEASLLAPHERQHFNHGLANFCVHLVDLFEDAKAPSYASTYAKRALNDLETGDNQDLQLQRQMTARLFANSMQTSRYDDAFTALTKQSDLALRKQILSEFLNSILSTSSIDNLLRLPWPTDLAKEADTHLEELCAKPESVAPAPSAGLSLKPRTMTARHTSTFPHKMLYAWRTQRNDYRGAAAALWERIQMLKVANAEGIRGNDVDSELEEVYLLLINCLVLVEDKMRWLLVQPVELPTRILSTLTGQDGEVKRGARRIVTVEDIRREYQTHLDRMADVAAGRYPMPLETEHASDVDDMVIDERMNRQGDFMSGALMPYGTSNGAMEVDVFAA